MLCKCKSDVLCFAVLAVLISVIKSLKGSFEVWADLAQLVERVAFNHVVVGSNPTVGEFVFTILWKKFYVC